MLRLSEIGSSIDTRFPEDATIRDDFYQSIIADDLDIRNSYEEADIKYTTHISYIGSIPF